MFEVIVAEITSFVRQTVRALGDLVHRHLVLVSAVLVTLLILW